LINEEAGEFAEITAEDEADALRDMDRDI